MSLDARLGLVTLIAALLFLWPLLAYGRASDFQDSAAYYKGGHRAVTFVLNKVESRPGASSDVAVGSSPGADVTPDGRPRETRGSRSVAYSIAAYLLGWPHAQMWLMAAAQALAAAFVSGLGLVLFGDDIRGASAKAMVLAVATPVAFVACLVTPDLFAGLVIFIIALIAAAYSSLSRGVRTVSVALASASVAFHDSHLPLALGLTVVAAAWLLLAARRRQRIGFGQWACLLAPFLIGATVTAAMNSVAWGRPSLTGKRYPLTLARSISEGPAKWYLDKNCGRLKYAVCEVYPHGVPGKFDDFLWGKDGLTNRASLEQLNRIRAEEAQVVLAAAKAYPVREFGGLAYNVMRQLGRFYPGVGLHMRLVIGPDGNPVAVPASYNHTWPRLVGALSFVSVLGALAFLFRRRRSLGELRPIVGLVLFGIILNATICVYFAGISERYQARVVWLIPLLGLMALGPIGQRVRLRMRGAPLDRRAPVAREVS